MGGRVSPDVRATLDRSNVTRSEFAEPEGSVTNMEAPGAPPREVNANAPDAPVIAPTTDGIGRPCKVPVPFWMASLCRLPRARAFAVRRTSGMDAGVISHVARAGFGGAGIGEQAVHLGNALRRSPRQCVGG